MKSVSTIPALIMAAAACVSLTAFAASPTEPPQAAAVQTDKPDAKKVQPHSHLQEKTGMMPQKKTAKAKPEEEKAEIVVATEDKQADSTKPKSPSSKKLRADQDKSKHYHPRDGK